MHSGREGSEENELCVSTCNTCTFVLRATGGEGGDRTRERERRSARVCACVSVGVCVCVYVCVYIRMYMYV